MIDYAEFVKAMQNCHDLYWDAFTVKSEDDALQVRETLEKLCPEHAKTRHYCKPPLIKESSAMIDYRLKLLTPNQADRLKEAERYVYSDGTLIKEIIRIKLTDPSHWHWNSDILYDRVKGDLSDAMITLCEQTSYAVTFDTAPYVASHMARLGNVLHRAWREYVTEEVEANRARYLEEGWTLVNLQRTKRDRELL